MKVYVLQKGEYDERCIVGIYSSIQGAMAYQEGWHKSSDREFWHNGRDFNESADITVYELDPARP